MDDNEIKQLEKLNAIMDDVIQEAFDFKIPLPDPIPDINIHIPIDIPTIPQIKDDIKNSILGPFERAINNSIIRPVNNTIKDGVRLGESIVNNIIGGLQDGINDFFNFITTVVNFINETAARFIQMGKGMNDIFNALFVKEPEALGKGFRQGFAHIGELFKWTGEYVFSYINCGVQYIQNLHRCITFYLIDTIGYILYGFFVGFPLWFMITFLKRDLTPTVDKLWEKIYEADKYVYGYTGIHIAHYPKGIRDLCYNCKRMKTDALKDKVKQISYDFSTKMPILLGAGVKQMQTGASEFAHAFDPKIVIPPGQKLPIDPNSIPHPVIPRVNAPVNDVIPEINF
jgi:hypothetical protein